MLSAKSSMRALGGIVNFLTEAPLWISIFPPGSCTISPAPASANSRTAPGANVYVC